RRPLKSFPTRRSSDLNFGRSRMIRDRAGDRHQLVESLQRARPAIDVDAGDELRVGSRFADERPILGRRDGEVLVPATSTENRTRSEEHTSELQSPSNI